MKISSPQKVRKSVEDMPTCEEYVDSMGVELRSLQRRIVDVAGQTLKSAVGYSGVVKRAEALARTMRELGYGMLLLDDNTESMIVFGAKIAEGRSITTYSYWDDDDDGASGSLVFRDGKDVSDFFIAPDGQISARGQSNDSGSS